MLQAGSHRRGFRVRQQPTDTDRPDTDRPDPECPGLQCPEPAGPELRDGRPADGDARLLERLRSGDAQAFDDLVTAWSPAMLRLARAFVRTRQGAEDVVQDAWLAVVAGLHRFEGRSSLRTWVFAIVVNRARTTGSREARSIAWSQLADGDAQRTVDRGRFQGPDGEYPGHWSSVGAPARWAGDPERRLLGRARGLVEAALVRLPERQRIAITLRDVVGLDAEETCRVLGVTAQNQRVLLHRGRAAVREALEAYYQEAGHGV